MARIFSDLPSEKKAPLFFYRPVPVTAVVRSGVVAVVPLHRPISVTAIVGDGVMVVVPLHRPISVTAIVGDGVTVVVPLHRPVSVTAVDGGVFRACRSLFHLASVITWP